MLDIGLPVAFAELLERFGYSQRPFDRSLMAPVIALPHLFGALQRAVSRRLAVFFALLMLDTGRC